MFGNLLTNALIDELRQKRVIQITPFDIRKLRKCYYELSWTEGIEFEKEGKQQFLLAQQGNPFVFEPAQYAVVTVKETIILGHGIFGLFVPASSLIELGFGITVGKLDPQYGEKGERIKFGMRNLLSRQNRFRWNTPLAHILFYDLRSLRSDPDPGDPLELVKVDVRKTRSIADAAEKLQKELDAQVPWSDIGKRE